MNTDEDKIILDNGDHIKYDILILATGSTGNFPNKLKEQDTETAMGEYKALYDKVYILLTASYNNLYLRHQMALLCEYASHLHQVALLYVYVCHRHQVVLLYEYVSN